MCVSASGSVNVCLCVFLYLSLHVSVSVSRDVSRDVSVMCPVMCPLYVPACMLSVLTFENVCQPSGRPREKAGVIKISSEVAA